MAMLSRAPAPGPAPPAAGPARSCLVQGAGTREVTRAWIAPLGAPLLRSARLNGSKICTASLTHAGRIAVIGVKSKAVAGAMHEVVAHPDVSSRDRSPGLDSGVLRSKMLLTSDPPRMAAVHGL